MKRPHPWRQLRSVARQSSPTERLLLTFCVILLVICIALEVQTQQQSRQADRIEQAATTAKQVLNDAVNNPQARAQAQATADAIAAIKRTEHAVCGGPCPAVPTTQPGEPP